MGFAVKDTKERGSLARLNALEHRQRDFLVLVVVGGFYSAIALVVFALIVWAGASMPVLIGLAALAVFFGCSLHAIGLAAQRRTEAIYLEYSVAQIEEEIEEVKQQLVHVSDKLEMLLKDPKDLVEW